MLQPAWPPGIRLLFAEFFGPIWPDRTLSAWQSPLLPVSTNVFWACRRDWHQRSCVHSSKLPHPQRRQRTLSTLTKCHQPPMGSGWSSSGCGSFRYPWQRAQPDIPIKPSQGLSDLLPHQCIQITTRWWSSTYCPGWPGAMCIDGHHYACTWCLWANGDEHNTITVNSKNTTQIQVREAIPPNHTPPSVSYCPLKYPSRTMGSPIRVLSITPPGTPRRPGTLYCCAACRHNQQQEACSWSEGAGIQPSCSLVWTPKHGGLAGELWVNRGHKSTTAHVAILGCTQQGPMGTDPANRRSTPSPGLAPEQGPQ